MYCLIGDGESAEGAIWEALHLASHYRLDNLVAVFDINRLGQSEATSLQHEMDVYQRRLTAFGLVTFIPVTFKNLICFGRNFAKHCGLIAFKKSVEMAVTEHFYKKNKAILLITR